MNRRHFLGSLAALSAGMALDVDKLLWVPGRKTYFDFPKIPDSAYGTIYWGNHPIIWGELSDDDIRITRVIDWPEVLPPGVRIQSVFYNEPKESRRYVPVFFSR